MARRGRPRHPDILTPREWEVLALLREGLSNEVIAERLSITERTARYHVSEILGKLGVATRQAAAAWQPSERRPWWAMATAPLLLVRKLRVGWLASAAAGVAAVGCAAAVGLLIWGIAHTGGASPDSSAVATAEPFTELRAVNGVLSEHSADDCGDAATSMKYGVPQALEFSRDPRLADATLVVGLEAAPYDYVPEQLAAPLGAVGDWEVSQRPILYRSNPGGFFLPEFFLRRLDKPDLVFRYGADLCVQADGQLGSTVYASEGSRLGDRIELPSSLPRVITHRPPGNVTAQQAIDIGNQGAWADGGTRVVWAEYGYSDDLHFATLREDTDRAYWAIIVAMGDAGGPHRPGRELGVDITIDGEDASIRSYGCCLDLLFGD